MRILKLNINWKFEKKIDCIFIKAQVSELFIVWNVFVSLDAEAATDKVLYGIAIPNDCFS